MVNNRNIQRNVFRNVVKRNNGRNNLVIRNVSGKTKSAISYVTLVYCASVILASIVMLILGNEVWSKSTVESDGTRRFSKYTFKKVKRSHVAYPGVEGFTGVLNNHISNAEDALRTKQDTYNSFKYLIDNDNKTTTKKLGKTIQEIEELISRKENELRTVAPDKKDKLNLLIIHLREQLKEAKLQRESNTVSLNLQKAKNHLATLKGARNSASAGAFDKLKLSMTLRTYNIILVIILVFHLGLASLVSSKL